MICSHKEPLYFCSPPQGTSDIMIEVDYPIAVCNVVMNSSHSNALTGSNEEYFLILPPRDRAAVHR